MSPESHAAQGGGGSFPRVSGDEPAKSALGNLGNTFSPRERG